MALRRGYFALIPLLILALSGCFRQASQPLDPVSQPVSNTAAPPDAATPTVEVETEGPTSTDSSAVDQQETPGLAITVETSTPALQATNTSEPLVTPTNDPGGGINVVPLESPSATSQVVTPFSPPGQSAIQTPTPSVIDATPTPSGLITPTQTGGEVVGDCVYVVQPGDNLYRISINHNTTLDALRAANPNIIGDIIQPGDRINLPDCEAGPGTGGSVAPPATDDGGITGTGTQTVHIVQTGETLSVIARQYGVTITDIVQANNLANPNQLSVGQELIIPAPQ